jgi:polysaccharide export outer membrane protein
MAIWGKRRVPTRTSNHRICRVHRPNSMIRKFPSRLIFALLCCAASACPLTASAAASSAPSSAPPPPSAATAAVPENRRLVELGPGDQVSLEVYGQPDMNSTLYVGNDGTISVPLAGPVQVSGMTPVIAAKRVESALIHGKFLVAPHVTIALLVGKSQRVSVLGEVRTPGRYTIDPNTSIFDLLAQAGGTTQEGADVVYILRTDADGKVNRYEVDLKALGDRSATGAAQTLESGDEIMVPRAEQFYIYGEVTNPNKYRIERGMTVVEAIARAGGVTPRGSERRVDIKRMGKDGNYIMRHAKASDLVEPNDVIRVKESIF